MEKSNKNLFKDYSTSIFRGIYVYKDEFVIVKKVNGKHIAESEKGEQFHPFDVITKGQRVNTSNKNQDTIN